MDKNSLSEELEKAMIKRRVMKIANKEFLEHNEASNIVNSVKEKRDLYREYKDVIIKEIAAKNLKGSTVGASAICGMDSSICAHIIQDMVRDYVNSNLTAACGVGVASAVLYVFYFRPILKHNNVKNQIIAHDVYENSLFGAENKHQLEENVDRYLDEKIKQRKQQKEKEIML